MNKIKITRRRFLALAGGATGAAALACCGLTKLAVQKPAPEMIETSCGERSDVGNKILIAYASQCGSTGEVAQAIGQTLCQAGAAVDVRPVQAVSDTRAYRAVILGSAVYRTKLLPQAIEFIQANQADLAHMPLAYFVVCATLKDDTEENRRRAAAFLEPLRQVVSPVDEGLFAGVIDYAKVSLLEQAILRLMGGSEGDWRNWNTIQKWAADLSATMSNA
jgi:menaquinone-dependent protoporphyrinogen oxidase